MKTRYHRIFRKKLNLPGSPTRRLQLKTPSTTDPARTRKSPAGPDGAPVKNGEGEEELGLHDTKTPLQSGPTAVTATEYATLQDAYDYLNVSLFDGSLSQVLITLQRHPRALGYFSPKRFRRRTAGQERVHEVALNPDGFKGQTDEEVLSTLVHEMVHVWQQEHGEPGRGRYHNREWARKMHGIGLMPSSTGKPGGATTGDSMSDYILEGGRFQVACREFLKCHRLVWESGTESARGPEGNDEEDAEGKKLPTRPKFTCPICGLNSWGKPSSRMLCADCSQETGELIPLIREDASGPEPQTGRDGDAVDSQYDRAIEILTNATKWARRANISLEEFQPALVDFTAAVALGVRGEEGLRAFIVRMEGRIDDWRNGTFPVGNSPRSDASRRATQGERASQEAL